MKLRNIRISNFRRVQSMDLNLDGRSAVLTGRNGAGKSSIIDAVWVALTGKDVPDAPIHHGAHKAEIEIDLGKYRVSKTWSASGSRLLVEAMPEGVPQKSPQALLDKVIGDISFDPFDFIQARPGVQRQMLMDILALDFSDLDARKRQALDGANRAKSAADALERQIEAIQVPEEPVERVDVSRLLELAEQRRKLESSKQEHKSKIDEIDRWQEAASGEVEGIEAQIAQLQERIATVRANQEKAASTRAQNVEDLQSLETHLDAIGNPMEEIRTADSTNRIADAQEQKTNLVNQLQAANRSIETTKSVAAEVENERAARIAAAQFPVPGLSFSEDGVLFEGLPLSDKQLSTAKVIEIGIAIAISRNPGLRICRIKDGSLLDSHTTDRIMETCHKHGFQVLVERVGDGDLHAEILEDADTTEDLQEETK